MKVRTHRHKIKFPIFGYEIRVSFVSSLKDEAVRMNADAPGDDTAKAWTVLNSEHPYAHIVLQHDASAEIIAHESFHAIWALMTWAGAALEDEVVAYHLGHVVGRITKWGNRSAIETADVKRTRACVIETGSNGEQESGK